MDNGKVVAISKNGMSDSEKLDKILEDINSVTPTLLRIVEDIAKLKSEIGAINTEERASGIDSQQIKEITSEMSKTLEYKMWPSVKMVAECHNSIKRDLRDMKSSFDEMGLLMIRMSQVESEIGAIKVRVM